VPADEPEEVPGTLVVGRYWAEIDPMQGRLVLFPLHQGNVIYRSEHTLAVNYDYGGAPGTQGSCQPAGNCLPAANTVRLSTNPAAVIYKDSNGVCHSNNAVVACPAAAPCNNLRTFCAPIQMVSNYTGAAGATLALPDVMVQLSQQNNLANQI